MKIFKVISVIIVIVSLILVLLFTTLGLGIFGGVYSLVQQSNEEVIQKIEHINNEVKIIVPLYEEIGIKYTDIKICSEKEKDDLFFQRVVLENGSTLSSDLACSNERCTLSIDTSTLEEIPEYLYLFVENDEKLCNKTKYMTQGHVLPLQYTATVEFTEELKQILNIDLDDKYTVEGLNSKGLLVYQIMGTKKAVFSYNKKIMEDVLLVDTVKKATLIFDVVFDDRYMSNFKNEL